MGNDAPQSPLSDEQQAMWDRLDAELEPLIDGGALYQAIERLGSTLETIGDDPQSAPLRAKLLARRGECHLDLDRGEQALADARQAIELGGGDAESYGLAGWASYHLDKTTPARDYFDRALDADSDDIALLTGRALVLMELDEFERARADLAHALHHAPEADDLLALRGEVHLQLGDLESAARDLEAAVEIAPNEPEYALMYARLLVVQGDTTRALDIASGAVDEAEDFALEALLLRSHLYLLAGDNQSARADAIRASNLYPDEAFAFVQLAHVQLADGNLDMAQKAAERAVGLDPSLSDSYMVRGTAHQMAGDNEAAKEDFERASRAPAELPMLLLGPAHDLVEGSATGFDPALLEMLREQASSQGFDPSSFADAFDGDGPAMAGMGMDPMNMLDQIFDDSGNIRGPLKPIFKMAFKNAPKIMENLPPGLLGDLDEEQLEEMDFSEMSSEDIEERMREFYQMMKSGDAPFSPPQEGDSDDDDPDDTPS